MSENEPSRYNLWFRTVTSRDNEEKGQERLLTRNKMLGSSESNYLFEVPVFEFSDHELASLHVYVYCTETFGSHASHSRTWQPVQLNW